MDELTLPTVAPPRVVRDERRPAAFTADEFMRAVVLATVVFCAGTGLTGGLFLAPSLVFTVANPEGALGVIVPAFGFLVTITVVTALVVGVAGWPIALLVATLLRRVRRPGVHLAVHGVAAAAVATGTVTLVAGNTGSPLATLSADLAAGWPVVAGAVVSTWTGWLIVATGVRRTEGQAPSVSIEPVSIDSVSNDSATPSPSPGSGRA